MIFAMDYGLILFNHLLQKKQAFQYLIKKISQKFDAFPILET